MADRSLNLVLDLPRHAPILHGRVGDSANQQRGGAREPVHRQHTYRSYYSGDVPQPVGTQHRATPIILDTGHDIGPRARRRHDGAGHGGWRSRWLAADWPRD